MYKYRITMKKENKNILISIAGLTAIYLLYQFKKIKDINIKIKKFVPDSINIKGIKGKIILQIDNISNLQAAVKDIEYKIFYNGSLLLDEKQTIDQLIKPLEKTEIPINVNVNFGNLIKKIGKGLLSKNRILEIQAKINIKVLYINWPIVVNYKINL